MPPPVPLTDTPARPYPPRHEPVRHGPRHSPTAAPSSSAARMTGVSRHRRLLATGSSASEHAPDAEEEASPDAEEEEEEEEEAPPKASACRLAPRAGPARSPRGYAAGGLPADRSGTPHQSGSGIRPSASPLPTLTSAARGVPPPPPEAHQGGAAGPARRRGRRFARACVSVKNTVQPSSSSARTVALGSVPAAGSTTVAPETSAASAPASRCHQGEIAQTVRNENKAMEKPEPKPKL